MSYQGTNQNYPHNTKRLLEKERRSFEERNGPLSREYQGLRSLMTWGGIAGMSREERERLERIERKKKTPLYQSLADILTLLYQERSSRLQEAADD